METEKAIKSQKDEDSSEGTHHAKDVETTGQIMHRAESFSAASLKLLHLSSVH